MNSSMLTRVGALLGVLLLVVVVYRPGLGGPFVLDDYSAVINVSSMTMPTLDADSVRDAFFSAGRSWPRRGLSRLSFALNNHFSGAKFDPVAIKTTNLAIHLLNGLLVFFLTNALVRRVASGRGSGASSPPVIWLPIAVAAVWLLHPIQLTSVLYAVQRMTSLAGTFVLLGLLGFVVGRARLAAGRARGFVWMTSSLVLGGLLGFLCKQNAVLLPLFAFLIELTFFERRSLSAQQRRGLNLFYIVTVALPVLLGLVALFVAWDFVLATYPHRHYTPFERVLTEARVLWFYLGLVLLPDIGRFSLVHDTFQVSAGWLTPVTTLPAVLGWGALGIASLIAIRRQSLWAFGVLWYLVGHAIESSVIGLELVFEHRNYLPLVGPFIAAALYLQRAIERTAPNPRVPAVLVLAVVALLSFVTLSRASTWSDRERLFESTLARHPDSGRANGQYAMLLQSRVGDPFTIVHHWQQAARHNPREIFGLTQLAQIFSAYLLNAADSEAGRSAPTAHVDPISSPLQADPAYLAAALEGTADLIDERLRSQPLESSSARALLRISSCVEQGSPPCAALEERVLNWMDIAAASERVLANERAVLKLAYARMLAKRGRDAQALREAEAALDLSPRDVGLRFGVTRVYVSLGRRDLAAASLLELEALTSASGVGSKDLEALAEEIR